MKRLVVSGAVRPLYGSLGVKGLIQQLPIPFIGLKGIGTSDSSLTFLEWLTFHASPLYTPVRPVNDLLIRIL